MKIEVHIESDQLDRIEAGINRLLNASGAQLKEGRAIMGALDDLKAELDAAAAQAAQNENIEMSALGVFNTLLGKITDLETQLANAGIPPELVAQATALKDGLATSAQSLAAGIAAIPSAPAAPATSTDAPPPAA